MRRLAGYPLWIGHVLNVADIRQIHSAGVEALVDLAINEPVTQISRELIYCRFPLVDGSGNRPELLRLTVQTTARLIEDRLEVTQQRLVLSVQRFVMQKVADHIEDGAVQHDVALLDRLLAEGLHQEALPDPRLTEDEHVPRLADEAAGGQIEELLFVDRGD